ncbi:MAG: hypothetical protein RR877_09830 [Aurantimicrobium sp.]|uniref:hypothetical protein n=1 Tax=Aurantimicrobium sp. TaxID=1930784 RepID=UPI002FC602BA
MVFPNLSDNTVRTVVTALNNYLPSQHLEGFLKALDAAVGDAEASSAVPNATTSVRGKVFQGAAVPNAVAAPTKAEFDALLASLRTANILAP